MPELARRCEGTLLDRAARIALRGHGGCEPNPMVGCVIADHSGNVIAEAHHARVGQDHAERIALERAGESARGMTLYTTLEPCTHQGRTPPCTEAIIESGIGRVVFATADPNPIARGGADVLRQHGIEVEQERTRATDLLNAPYLHRTRTGLPWIIAKWAQTLDGRIATSSGDARWISSPRSRRLVHRERGRVDAILTGIGTVLADDPQLTARDARTLRRIADRVVIDDQLDLPLDSTLVRSAREQPVIVLCAPGLVDQERGRALAELGVLVQPLDGDGSIRASIARLGSERGWSNVLVEAGGGLLGRLFVEGLVDEALVFIAPTLLGDADAPGPLRGRTPSHIGDGITLEQVATYPRSHDTIAWYRTTPLSAE